MLIIPPPKFRVNRKPAKIVPKTGPAAVVLQAASYAPGLAIVTLTFDRPVVLGSVITSSIVVNDPVTQNEQFMGSGPAVAYGANGIQVALIFSGSTSGSQVRMSVGNTNGIAAVNDGGKFAGVSELVLPFP
jgi:hypothetical protein